MKIDRSNYEIWFIDWLDGKLNDYQLEQLNLFLSENPTLQEELKATDIPIIIPPANEFKGKSRLNRTPGEITESQFEYLCVANAENDLLPEELDEFDQIISANSQRRRISELYIKLKLKAPYIRYLNKKKLLKKTPLQKTLRFSFALLSAAATVALLITISIFISGNEKESKENITQLITNEGGTYRKDIPLKKDNIAPELNQSREAAISKTQVIFTNEVLAVAGQQDPAENEITESLNESLITERIHRAEVPSISDIITLHETHIDNLALIPLSFEIHVQSDERWAAGRYLAKLFRDKILKDDEIDDSPIKGYEIAEAGVTGLNKLLGWEMAFEKNCDENGELKSIYFSSKILKVQTPVNRTESSY
jgi:hypothetical protein